MDLRRWIDAERPQLLAQWKVLTLMPSWGDQVRDARRHRSAARSTHARPCAHHTRSMARIAHAAAGSGGPCEAYRSFAAAYASCSIICAVTCP